MTAANGSPIAADRPPVGPTLEIPDPGLLLLVGIAGAGKSTFARTHFAPAEILSSDAFRERVSGSEADQRASETAFRLLHAAAGERLTRRLLTVVDATNTQHWSREPLIRLAQDAELPAAAIVLDLPLDVCLGRARDRRDRPVRASVLRQQHRGLRHALDWLPLEGLEPIHLLHDEAEVGAARIVRLGGTGYPAAQ